MSRFSVGWAGLLGLALACTGDGIETLDSGATDTAELVPAENQAPIVITVPVIDAVPGTTVTLAAQAVDADGEVTDTEWAQTGGPDVTLADPESLVATFEAPVPSADLELRFALTVTDDDGEQAEAVVTVRVEANAQPLLEVAGPAEVSPGDTVTLFASVTHDFGDPAGIAWAQTAGETVTLTPSASGLSASFEAPSTRYGTDLAFTATATDRFGATATASLPLAVEGTIDGEIRDVLHDVILVDFQTVRPGGYLFTDEPGAGVFKWTRTDTGPALNITSTIARFFGEAGYDDLADLGVEDMYLRTDADPGDPAVQWAGDLGLFLWAHDRTGEQRFLDRATAMFDAMVLDFTFDEAYPRDFDPFVGLWGYDAQHALFSDYMADKKGLAGASDHLASQVAWYEARYEAKVEEDHYNAIFTNLIAEWYGIGKRIDKYTFEAEDLWVQYTAFAMMGDSIDQDEGAEFLLDHLRDDDLVSEEIAEAAYALHRYLDR